jgi:AcrR family transcriptional regulator
VVDVPQPQQVSIWRRPPRGARGPAPEHGLAEIAAAGVGLAATGGLAAVSMRAVATALGTTASSLYRYVTSRDELLDLMVDTIMANFEHTPAPGSSPVDELVQIARTTRTLYRDHPWLMDVRQAHSAPGPHTLVWFEHCLRAMTPLDLPGPSKMEAIGVLNGVVMLFARSETSPAGYDLSAATPQLHPQLIGVLTGGSAGAVRGDLFERTVRAVLNGLLAP